MLLIFIKCDHEQCARVKDDSGDFIGGKPWLFHFYPANFFTVP